MNAVAHTDGGNRQKYACSAAVLLDEYGDTHERYRVFEGTHSNNFAEYHGVLLALKLGLELKVTHLSIFSDSQLVVNHLNGVYQVKTESLKPLFKEAIHLARFFHEVSIEHAYRQFNTYPDAICNYEMDRIMGKNLKNSNRRMKNVRMNPPSGVLASLLPQ